MSISRKDTCTKDNHSHQIRFAVELKNICVKIPLLNALKDIPIYAKIVRDLCIRKQGSQKMEPPTIQIIGNLESFIGNFAFKGNGGTRFGEDKLGDTGGGVDIGTLDGVLLTTAFFPSTEENTNK